MTHIKGILLIFFVSSLLSFSYNYISPSGIALFGSWDRTQGVVSANGKQTVIKRDIEINTLEEMKEIIKNNSAMIIDVRLPEVFKAGHIPGAKSFSLSLFDELIGNFYEAYGMGQKIIVYCSSRECKDSHTFADKLSKMGYKSIKVFSGGFSEWEQGDCPVEKN